jgi:hypothetical protein
VPSGEDDAGPERGGEEDCGEDDERPIQRKAPHVYKPRRSQRARPRVTGEEGEKKKGKGGRERTFCKVEVDCTLAIGLGSIEGREGRDGVGRGDRDLGLA